MTGASTIDPAALQRAEASLRTSLRGQVQSGVALARSTYYRIGGPADLLVDPEGTEDLSRVLATVREERLPLTVLGLGSNVLIDDEGIRGVTLRMGRGCGSLEIEDRRIRAGAGVPLAQLSSRAAKSGLRGLEFAVLVPGNLGGAVYMNAGAHRQETRQLVTRVRALDREGAWHELSNEECRFGYRDSRFQHERFLIVEADLVLEPGDPDEIEARMKSLREERAERMPVRLPCAGATFKSPPGDFAGRLIEASGCKGMRVGGAQVSELHANYFVNDAGATAADVRELIRRVRDRVAELQGIRLEREVIFVGGADGGDLPYHR